MSPYSHSPFYASLSPVCTNSWFVTDQCRLQFWKEKKNHHSVSFRRVSFSVGTLDSNKSSILSRRRGVTLSLSLSPPFNVCLYRSPPLARLSRESRLGKSAPSIRQSTTAKQTPSLTHAFLLSWMGVPRCDFSFFLFFFFRFRNYSLIPLTINTRFLHEAKNKRPNPTSTWAMW